MKNEGVIIFGISSHLGVRLAEGLVNSNLVVIGTYRNWNENLEKLYNLYKSKKSEIHLFKLDLDERDEIINFVKNKISLTVQPISKINIIYLCGIWIWGEVKKIDEKDFNKAFNINVKTPYFLISQFLNLYSVKFKIILVTGLGDRKNAVAENSVFTICNTSIYILVQSLGLELGNSGSVCIGLALGLFDKSQPYVKELASFLNKKLMSITKVSDFLKLLILKNSDLTNGSVIELSGGISNYKRTISFFKNQNIK